jgi:TPR repeat protein
MRSRLLIAAAAFALSTGAAKPTSPAPAPAAPPPIAADLQGALDAASAGKPDALKGLADGGRADAQFFLGTAYLAGRHGFARDPAKGCAYVEKASATRGDAALLAARCYKDGLAGPADPAKAKAALQRAVDLGQPKAKCLLGKLMLAEPASAAQGLTLCQEAAKAGDVDAQAAVADAYFTGSGVKADMKDARKWYDMAAKAGHTQSMRKLGQMYANGDGGKKDPKKAMELWTGAEKAGDPMASILVADLMFSDLTGKKDPVGGQYAFKGGINLDQVKATEAWYQEALKTDPRPEVKDRAKKALAVLASLKTAAGSTAQVEKKKR